MNITIERKPQGILLSTIKHSRLITKLYQGYSVKEARINFRAYVNSLKD